LAKSLKFCTWTHAKGLSASGTANKNWSEKWNPKEGSSLSETFSYHGVAITLMLDSWPDGRRSAKSTMCLPV